jgi:outer membrane protein assembly factor BamA
MHTRTAALFTLLILAAAGWAAERAVIRSIEIDGNRLTQRWVIVKELGLRVGDSVTADDLEMGRLKVNNLIFINSARIALDSVSGKLTVHVAEAWPLWPIIGFSLSEGRLSDILTKPRAFFRHSTVLFGASHLNIYGSGGGAYGSAQFGAAQGFDMGYYTRWLAPHLPFAVTAHFQNLREQSRHASVRDSTRYIRDVQYSLDISRHQGAAVRPGLYTAFISLKGEQNRSATRRDSRTVWFTPYLILDHRNVEWYPTRGSYVEVRGDFVAGTPRFVRSYYDLRGYFPMTEDSRSPSLALRFSAATSTDATPDWAHFYWGFNRALRGYSNEKSESSSYMIGEMEVRVPIGQETTYDVPFIGRWGKEWPWGVSALVYAQRGELGLAGRRDERTSYGAGVYLRAPWVKIVQASLGFRRDGSKDFITGIGISF